MADMLTGGCRCGQLRYRIAAAQPLPSYACHCLDCQKLTGSAFADQVVVAADSFTLTGESAAMTREAPSGGVTRYFICPDCHVRIGSSNSSRPGMVLLRGGSLDDPAPLRPFLHMWVKRKRDWIAIPDDMAQFDETPTAAQFMTLMARPGSAAG
jgi:hypothetical protein